MATTFSQLEPAPQLERPGQIIRLVVEAFYADYAEDAFPNAEARLDDLEQLATYASQFGSLTDLLTQLSLLTNLEAESGPRTPADDDRIRLSTVHQAKGLEFQVVFVVMLADGMFPSGRSLEHPDAEEEERRLFYVAVTRARDELYLGYPLVRTTPGQGMSLLIKSRFLEEIPPELVEEWTLRPSDAFGGGRSDPRGSERGMSSDPGELDSDPDDPF